MFAVRRIMPYMIISGASPALVLGGTVTRRRALMAAQEGLV